MCWCLMFEGCKTVVLGIGMISAALKLYTINEKNEKYEKNWFVYKTSVIMESDQVIITQQHN